MLGLLLRCTLLLSNPALLLLHAVVQDGQIP